MLCMYHSADFDGKCSAAIIKREFPRCELYGINYNDDVPWDLIRKHDIIIMVDFGLQPFSDMEKIHAIKGNAFHWIDHHKTAIDSYKEYLKKEKRTILGLREIGKAGCELTWEYIYPTTEMPRIVKMLGRFDVWDIEYDKDILPIQFGMKAVNSAPESKIWNDLLIGDTRLYKAILTKGEIIYQYQKEEWKRYCNSNSFEVEWEGHRFLAMNILNASSLAFESKYNPNRHDGMMAFGYKNGKYVVSLYGDKKDIDLSVIAVKYGGGGHQKACGFAVDKLPFL